LFERIVWRLAGAEAHLGTFLMLNRAPQLLINDPEKGMRKKPFADRIRGE